MKKISIILAVMGLASAGVIPTSPIIARVATHYNTNNDLGYAYIEGNGLVPSAALLADPITGWASAGIPAGAPIPTIALAPGVVSPIVADSGVAIEAAPLPATVVQQSSVPIAVNPEPANDAENTSAPVESVDNETTSEVPSTEEGSSPSVATQVISQTTIQQLITPVQDTPEVQAAKAAHLAAFEQVKLRDASQDDAPQEVHDAQENHIPAENEDDSSEESGESTESTSEGTETTASETSEASEPAVPSSEAQAALSTSPVVQAAISPLVRIAPPAPSPVALPSVAISPIAANVAAIPQPVVLVGDAPAAVLRSPIAPSPSGPVALEHVGQITSQYHSQDELGQYSYGYSGGPSAKHELKTADGLTSGGYSYIDSHGIVQSAAYVSDPVNGFRVAATNIPTQREPEYIPDSVEVAEAKQQLFKAQAEHIAKL